MKSLGQLGSRNLEIIPTRYDEDCNEYIRVREKMLNILSKYNVSLETFLKREEEGANKNSPA